MENQESNLARIRRLGRIRETVCLVAAVSVVPLLAAYWAAFPLLPGEMTQEVMRMVAVPVLPGWVRLLCFAVSLVPGLALVVTLLRLRALCALYREGHIFGLANVVCFRSLSRSLLVWAGASILYTPLRGLAVTAANPPGRHLLVLAFGGTELALFFLAALAVVITRVMEEARRLDEEQALTV